MIVDTHRVIFFHVPKAAGTTIENVLYSPRLYAKHYYPYLLYGFHQGRYLQHLCYRDMAGLVPAEKMESYFKFAFFRNTWDRLKSAFVYNRRMYERTHGTFEGLIRAACAEMKKGRISPGDHLCSQMEYLYRDQARTIPALDYQGHFEHLEEHLAEVCALINVPLIRPLRQLNQCPEPEQDYRTFYSDDLAELVADAYHEEISHFSYSFERPSLECSRYTLSKAV